MVFGEKRKEWIQAAVMELLDATDLAPGEVNTNIQKVMRTLSESQEQFNNIQIGLSDLLDSTQKLNENSTDMAEAGVDMARAANDIGESLNDLNDLLEHLDDDIDDLNDTMEKLEQYIPEEEAQLPE